MDSLKPQIRVETASYKFSTANVHRMSKMITQDPIFMHYITDEADESEIFKYCGFNVFNKSLFIFLLRRMTAGIEHLSGFPESVIHSDLLYSNTF